MTRQIHFNAFEMNCVAHQSPGLWTYPGDRSWQYKDVEYWQDLARILEGGLFDGVFIADVIGYYDVYRGKNDDAIREGAQIPVNDPLQLAVAIALASKNLGIGITASTSFEHPYTFARRISTADHLTKGRIGWNIVTSYLESGAKNVGHTGLRRHDNRYEVASEYLEVIYKLLEGSWEDGAVVRDRERRVFADPAKVHEIRHKGRFFDVPGYNLTEPSPQRTPVLYQAGASPSGIDFAARNAECVFVSAPTKEVLKRYIDRLRSQAQAHGRDGNQLVYNLSTVIVDETDAKAEAKYRRYLDHASYDGALTFISGWSGVDFAQFRPNDKVKKIETNAVQSLLEHFTFGREWTVAELAQWGGIGGLGPVFVGGPEKVADELQAWQEATGVDGFNLAYAVAHETFESVAGYLVPELQRRGAYRTAYTPGTLRHKLFGKGDRLTAPHPGASYRDLGARLAAGQVAAE